MNILCTGTFVMQVYMKMYKLSYPGILCTSVTRHFIVGTEIEILNLFTYTSLAPPTLFGMHGCETILIKDYDNEGSKRR